MNITHPNVQSFEFESTRSIDSGVEAIVFEIAEVWFGISLTKVEQIIDCTNNRSDLNILTKIEILDLHELLFGTKLLAPAAWTIFIEPIAQKSYGIPLSALPTLSLLPRDRLRILPPEFRASSPLGIASHIALIPNTSSPIFMMED